MTRRGLFALLLSFWALSACSTPEPPPADPQGKDLVEGAIVAAAESSGGLRIYKIVHVDDFPEPLGYDFHMVAYDPKVQTYREAVEIHKDRKLKVALPHILVRKVNFMPRDHRVIANEPVTEEEKQNYLKSLRTKP